MAAILAVGCHKEVALKVEMPHPTSDNPEMNIDEGILSLHNGDEVYANGSVCHVTSTAGTAAIIEDVASANAYRAIYPASIVSTHDDIIDSKTVSVTLPLVQHYEIVDGRQRVVVPMGAYLEGDGTLQFHSLCAVVRVVVNNLLDKEITIDGIILRTATNPLCGWSEAHINGNASDKIVPVMSWVPSCYEMRLFMSNEAPVKLGVGEVKSFDIVVPGFTTDDVEIRVNMPDGYFRMVKTGVSVENNTVLTITSDVTGIKEYAAVLYDGQLFNSLIPNSATAVVFEYNSTDPTGTTLSTNNPNSTSWVCGKMDGTTWRARTPKQKIYANEDCSKMFAGKENLQTIDFGDGLVTTGVSDMSEMFSGCSGLTSLNLTSFDMSCVENKEGMCAGLSTASGACTIICTEAVQAELENGTGLPTEGVVFTWVRPTSR